MNTSTQKRTGVALLGCGFVADYYMLTLPNHPELMLTGVFDTDAARLARFGSHHGVRAYRDFGEMLADPAVTIVINLTPPECHFATSEMALNAGKHVYSEKPLAMSVGDGQALAGLAAARGLSLSGAPCSLLGDAAQAMLGAIRRDEIGTPRLAYAAMEDGMVFREGWRDWRSLSGAPWPGAHEFEVGCTLEHAGYYLTWLCGFFGPVRRMTAFAAPCFPDKGAGATAANDLSVACMEHEGGVVSRLTCGLVAARDRSLTITGDTGTLSIDDGWDTRAPVRVRRERWHPAFGTADRILNGLEARLGRWLPGQVQLRRKLRLGGRNYPRPAFPSRMDFMGGPAHQAAALREGRPLRLPADFVLHITELALAIQNADRLAQPYLPVTSFRPLP